jgi:hypothetical protein
MSMQWTRDRHALDFSLRVARSLTKRFELAASYDRYDKSAWALPEKGFT